MSREQSVEIEKVKNGWIMTTTPVLADEIHVYNDFRLLANALCTYMGEGDLKCIYDPFNKGESNE